MSVPALRAPKEHGQILAVPSLDQVAALLDANRRKLESVRIPSIGKSLCDLRALARREALANANAYLGDAGQSCEPEAQARDAPWLVAGHQPELFHPGVWFKNFVLHDLAKKHGATAINLVVDTDAAKPAILHVPHDSRYHRVAYDRSSPEAAYEDRTVVEETTFADLPRQMAAITAKWPFEPMLPDFWREVLRHAERTPLMGERFAAARRDIERRWGVSQLEAPMSGVCRTEAFAWFVCSVLADLPRFHTAYNEIVHAYRQAHGIKSRSHPVPDLALEGEWLESPFWAWKSGGEGRRGKLMVRCTADAWHLRVGGELWPSIPASRLDRAVQAWQSLELNGYKVRSRALTTTMFARLFLADVFIHGIGGGIYDELTDRIMERFYVCEPPGYLVLSATLLLPLPLYPDAEAKIRELDRRRRDLIYKPERFVSAAGGTASLFRAKADWIAAATRTHAERAERYTHLRDLNARLAPLVLPQIEEVEADRREQRRRAEWDAVAGRRDYAFCLYPEEMLREFFGKTHHGLRG